MFKLFFYKKRSPLYAAYKILPNESLVVCCFSGTVRLKNIIAQKIEMNNDPLWNKEYTLILDTLDSEMDALLSEIDDFVNFFHSDEKYMIGKRKVAYIIRSQSQLAYTKFLKERQKNSLPQDVKIFSNFDNALEFLELNHLHDKIAATLQQLQKEFKVYV